MTALSNMPAAPANALITAAHVLDPRTGQDGPADVLVRDGVIAEIGAPGSLSAPEGVETLDGSGAHLFPAFVDPHVHLRVPGQEHKEDLETGTRAAAAGGYGAIVGMPNTSPPIDSASVLRSVRERVGRARGARGARAARARACGLHCRGDRRPAGRDPDRDGGAARRRG